MGFTLKHPVVFHEKKVFASGKTAGLHNKMSDIPKDQSLKKTIQMWIIYLLSFDWIYLNYL